MSTNTVDFDIAKENFDVPLLPTNDPFWENVTRSGFDAFIIPAINPANNHLDLDKATEYVELWVHDPEAYARNNSIINNIVQYPYEAVKNFYTALMCLQNITGSERMRRSAADSIKDKITLLRNL